jgi:hypothetical protein
MKDTFEAIYRRRAVKGFDPNHRLRAEEAGKLLEAAVPSPLKQFVLPEHILNGGCTCIAAVTRRFQRSP